MLHRAFAVAMLVLLTAARSSAGTLFDFNTTFRLFKGTTEPTPASLGQWRRVDYDDGAWPLVPGPFYYSSALGGVEPPFAPDGSATFRGTILNDMQNNYSCVYLRKSFVLTNAGNVLRLLVQATADDGFVAWVNGREIIRYNVPLQADPPYTGVSLSAFAEPLPLITYTITNSGGLLLEGTNILAVQAFNSSLSSSADFGVMVSASTLLDDPPAVLSMEPPAGVTVRDLTFVNVVFTENVTGVDARDLLVNGTPATGLNVISPREYSFTFPRPPTGTVALAWTPNPGIVDVDLTPHAFEPGPAWSCLFDPIIPVGEALITEFMAGNVHGVEDEDGSRSDWLELYNPGQADLNLEGWFLTDDPAVPTKWRIPGFNLGANKYRLIWASGKNRTNPAAPLHTSFKLSTAAGSHLALVSPQTNIISVFTNYPAQSADISYGRDRVDPGIVGYFVTPTPGAQNAVSGTGFALAPECSLESGVYSNATLTVTLTAAAGTVVRYTLDGSEPGTNATLYTAPITISSDQMLKARGYQAGLWPSPVVARTFVLVDATTRDFTSNLPILVLSTRGQLIPESVAPGGNRARGILVVQDTTNNGRSSLLGAASHQGLAQYEITGQTSAGFAKKPHRIELNDELGNDLKVPLLGLPAEADWILRNPYSDKCLMNDFLGYELWEDMGHYSVRRRLVEVFIDTSGGRLSYPGDYYGVMLLCERIEIGGNRVDIAEMSPASTNEPAISGGYIIKKDKDSTGDLAFTTTGGGGFSAQTLKFHEPKPRDITVAQQNYIRDYVNRFEAALYAANWTNLTGSNHYSAFIDVDAFVDQHLHVEFTKQIDGYRLSSYYSKDRNGKLKPDPIWDWNLSFGNANYLEGGKTNNWYWNNQAEGMSDVNHIWLRRLVYGLPAITTAPPWTSANGPGDPEFRQRITDRWGVLRTNVLNGDRMVARIDEVARLLTESAERNYAKYAGLLNAAQWPNPEGPPFDVDYTQTSYSAIIAEMKKWTKGRYLWMDSQFVASPVPSRPAGLVATGAVIHLTGAGGTIYYTLNGVDPRLPGGGVAPGARVYSGPITVTNNVRLVARALAPGTALWTPWSAPSAGTYVVTTPRLVISEIMYHPAPDPNGIFDDGDFEFIELMNVGTTTIALPGFRLTNGIQFTFTALSSVTTVPPGGTVLVVRNLAAFTSRYGAGHPVAGEFTGNLDNAGDQLRLDGPLLEPILDFAYRDGWYPLSDGQGFSLVLLNEQTPAAEFSLKESWRSSGRDGGSPGTGSDPAPVVAAPVVITEALTRHDTQLRGDLIEVYNPTEIAVDLGGWFLTDDERAPKKYRIPNGTLIAARSFRVFTESEFNPTPGSNTSFALGAKGDSVWLFAGDPARTNITGYFHGFAFGGAADNVSFGRFFNSLGQEFFVAQSVNTPGAPNAGPRIGPVILSEIMYHPPEADGADNVIEEYIELANIGDTPVALHDPAVPASTWRLRNAVDFDFPPGVTLPAGERLLVVGFDPVSNPAALARFRDTYRLPPGVPVYGPWSGKLDNSEETVELKQPGTYDPAGTGEILVEEVYYRDTAPWPAAADGAGSSLQRLPAGAFANDPANWIAAGLSPGRTSEPNLLPSLRLLTPVADRTFVRPAPIVLTALASDPDGTVDLVEYFDGVTRIGVATNRPYFRLAWTNAGYGPHVLSARARDNRLGLAFSGSVTVGMVSRAPSVTLTQPTNETIIAAGSALNLAAAVQDVDGAVTNVAFLANSVPLESDGSAPFETTWAGVPAGVHMLQAIATDDSGARGTSSVVRVSVAAQLNTNLVLVASNSVWRYLANVVDPGPTWTTPAFNDSAWPSGRAQIGWGDNDESTRVTNAIIAGGRTNRIITYYFRQQFVVDTFVGVTNVLLRLQRDDGGIVYLNGTEVFRSNMTNGPVNYGTLALVSVTGSDENALYSTNLPTSVLLPGTNTIAVEVHQARTNDNDLSFAAILQLNRSMVGPVIVRHPEDATVPAGGTATLGVLATGSDPLEYQWFFNGLPLPGETAPGLSLGNFQPALAGNYSVRVSNLAGVMFSLPAKVGLLSSDTDGDGLPDDWELANGTNPGVPDSGADPDGDGMTNGGEYLAGTHPQDPGSALRIESVAADGVGTTVITFVIAANRAYTLIQSPAPGDGSWLRVEDIPAGPVRRVSVTVPPGGATSRFFRIVTPPQP